MPVFQPSLFTSVNWCSSCSAPCGVSLADNTALRLAPFGRLGVAAALAPCGLRSPHRRSIEKSSRIFPFYFFLCTCLLGRAHNKSRARIYLFRSAPLHFFLAASLSRALEHSQAIPIAECPSARLLLYPPPAHCAPHLCSLSLLRINGYRHLWVL